MFLTNDERNDFMSNETTNKISLINLPDMPDCVDNAIQNITDEPTQNIGKTFGDLWYLVFGGISHLADKKRMKYSSDLEKYQKELSNSIDEIPEDKRIEPDFQIATQALENSKYCISSDILRKMFVNLISGNMNSDSEPLSHPSFPEVLKQMDETDAKILMELKQTGEAPIAVFDKTLKDKSRIIPYFVNAYISTLFCIPLHKCARSLTFLERVGFITLQYDTYFDDKTRYAPFEKLDFFKEIDSYIKSEDSNSYLTIRKGICRTTPLGKDFIELCVL